MKLLKWLKSFKKNKPVDEKNKLMEVITAIAAHARIQTGFEWPVGLR